MFSLERLESSGGIFLPQLTSDERRFQFHSNTTVRLCRYGRDLSLATRLSVASPLLRIAPVGLGGSLSGVRYLKKLLAPDSIRLTAGTDRPVTVGV